LNLSNIFFRQLENKNQQIFFLGEIYPLHQKKFKNKNKNPTHGGFFFKKKKSLGKKKS